MENKNRWLGTLSVIVIAIAAVSFLGAFAFGWHGGTMGYGMMGGTYGGGMWGTTATGGVPLSNEQAEAAAEQYIDEFSDPYLELAELMEFDNHFYAQVRELETGRYAFEFLIDRFSGRIAAEPGPNMMWNERYSHMGGFWGAFSRSSQEMSMTADEAVLAAQAYLDRYVPGLQADDHAAEFYGYYTLHTLRDGEIVGMLSVNGDTGAVWLHSWHGIYLSSLDGEIH